MSDAGLFGPGSVTWRVNREGVLLLGGGAALVLQVAHPLVAAGVAEFSNYREDPWGRLYRTLDLTTRIVFGDTETALEAGERIRNVHTRVHGVTKEPGGRYPAGTPYDATGLLPQRLRDELDLPWSPLRERLLGTQRALLRRLVPALPALVRDFPPARSARRRVRSAA